MKPGPVLGVLTVTLLSVAAACGSDQVVSPATYPPLVSVPVTTIEDGDPSTTVHDGRSVGVIRDGCAAVGTPCTALSIGGVAYVRGEWPLNEPAVQALGDVIGISDGGAVARWLFNVDTVIGYRSFPDEPWEALIAPGATKQPANEWLLCIALASPDPSWISCSVRDLASAGLTGHWMGAALQITDAGCGQLPDILRSRADNAVGSGSREEPMAYAVEALVGVRWIELGCAGHLIASPADPFAR